MNRVFVGMDVHKEKIVAVGLPEEGNHPVMREEFGGNDLSRLVKRLRQLAKSHRVEARAARRGAAAGGATNGPPPRRCS